MVDWPILLAGIAGILPAGAVLFWSYAPYDGHFKDNFLFLFFIGGMAGGVGLALFEAILSIPQDVGYRVGMVLVGFPLLEQGLKLVVLNRRSTQGDRAITFYGGAFALGFAAMATLFKSQRDITLFQYADLGQLLADPAPLLYLMVVGVAVTCAHFATGLLLGDAVRRRELPWPFVLSVAALVPLQFLVFEFVGGYRAGRASEGLVYLPVMVAYTGALAWWADRTLLPKALPPEAQKQRRRMLRRERRTPE